MWRAPCQMGKHVQRHPCGAGSTYRHGIDAPGHLCASDDKPYVSAELSNSRWASRCSACFFWGQAGVFVWTHHSSGRADAVQCWPLMSLDPGLMRSLAFFISAFRISVCLLRKVVVVEIGNRQRRFRQDVKKWVWGLLGLAVSSVWPDVRMCSAAVDTYIWASCLVSP